MLLNGSSIFHKGSSDSDSKSRKVVESGIVDIKGRNARVVVWWQKRSIAIGRVKSWAISSWRQSGKLASVTAMRVESKVGSREGAYDSLNDVVGDVLREAGNDSMEFQVGQEVQDLGPEVKDKPFQ